MFSIILFSLFISSSQAQFDNMDDEDFAKFLEIHDDFGQKYGESMTKGCLTGAIGAAPSGFAALCIGCTFGAAGNFASDFLFREKK